MVVWPWKAGRCSTSCRSPRQFSNEFTRFFGLPILQLPSALHSCHLSHLLLLALTKLWPGLMDAPWLCSRRLHAVRPIGYSPHSPHPLEERRGSLLYVSYHVTPLPIPFCPSLLLFPPPELSASNPSPSIPPPHYPPPYPI